MTNAVTSGLPAFAREIAAAGYDRSPGLSESERQVTALWLTPGTHVITRGKLPRLYDPLAHIFLRGDEDRANRTASVKHLLVEVGRAGRTYWDWDGDHWLDLMHRRPIRSGHVMAAAYLLCGFRRLSEVRTKPCLAGVARIVFGRSDTTWLKF